MTHAGCKAIGEKLTFLSLERILSKKEKLSLLSHLETNPNYRLM